MKKLTKRVLAGGLWFDVPFDTQYVAMDETAGVFAYSEKPVAKGWFCDVESSSATEVCRVDLEGADWRECCWYVGDQVDGEAAERREWMARGVDTFGEYHNFSDKQLAQFAAKEFAKKIRAGEAGV